MNRPVIERLTPSDLINLYVETPSAPVRIGAVAVLDGRAMLDPDGRLPIADLRTQIERRSARVPRLRQVVHRGGPLAGRPVWADDPAFRIDRHVHEVALPTGQALTDVAMRLVMLPLDQKHPLWRMWFVTGLPGGEIGVVFALHHVVADGITTLRLVGALFDDDAGSVTGRPWAPQPPPSWAALVRDNLRGALVGLSLWRAPHPSQWRMIAGLRHAPRTSLNRPVGRHRRLSAVTVDLAAVKEVAHRHGGKINDVVLALAAGGVRELLRNRSEPVDGVRLNVSVAVSLRAAGPQADVGNRTGAIAVSVPLEADPHRRLRAIVRESAQAKGRQLPTVGNGLLVGLSRFGLLRYFSRHQRMINFVVSNVAGPPGVLRLLGAPVRGVVPIGALVGNLSVGFLALSYAGRLTIAVQADAAKFPDLPVLVAAMRREWGELLSSAPELGNRSAEAAASAPAEQGRALGSNRAPAPGVVSSGTPRR